MASKVLASFALLVGGVGTIINLAVAFGVHVTPDQHTAIESATGLFLLILGAWFHPDVPVGVKNPPTP